MMCGVRGQAAFSQSHLSSHAVFDDAPMFLKLINNTFQYQSLFRLFSVSVESRHKPNLKNQLVKPSKFNLHFRIMTIRMRDV